MQLLVATPSFIQARENKKKLRNILLLLLLSSALFSCRAKYGVGNERRYSQSLRDAFIKDFKTISFCKCLEAGNNYKTSEDVSCRYPDYLYTEGDVIENLVQVEQSKIIRDSVDRIGRVAEGMEGKRVVEICLEFYQSKALDSVARSRYRLDELNRRKTWH